MKPRYKLHTLLLLLAMLLPLVWIGYLMWQFDRPHFPLSRLQQLHGGMNTNDVQRVLGSPSSVRTRTNNSGQVCSEWAYSRRISWPIVYVYFTPDGRFEGHRYDH
jgi:hypothetical protein